MAQCAKCGTVLADHQRFCPRCGQQAPAASTTAPAAAAPVQSPPPQGVPPQAYPPQGYPPVGGYAPGAWQGQAPRKSSKAVWITLAAVVAVLAVAAVLVFVVFKDQIFNGGTAGANGPEKAVLKYLDAVEDRDVDALFAVINPDDLDELTSSGRTLAEIKDAVKEDIPEDSSVKFSGVKMETDMTGEDRATVTITEGKMTTIEDGKSVTDDIEDAAEPPRVQVVRQDGKWYVDLDSLGAMLGLGDLSTGGETGKDEETETSTTIEDETGLDEEGTGYGGPEAAVRAYLTALVFKDADSLFGVLDPEGLEQIYGTEPGFTDDELKSIIAEGMFTYDSLAFSGLQMQTEMTSESTANVTIIAGTMTSTIDGETESVDISESGQPTTYHLIERDGQWYIDPMAMLVD
jgi:hypothetical protein